MQPATFDLFFSEFIIGFKPIQDVAHRTTNKLLKSDSNQIINAHENMSLLLLLFFILQIV